MSPHLALSVGAVASILQFAMPLLSLAGAQGFSVRSRASNESRVVVVHDRLTNSTRLSAPLTSSQPFGLGSQAWVDLSFSFVGTRLVTPPSSVVLTIESWTPARGGWAFAHPQPLRIESGDSLRLEVPPAGYLKRRVHLLDSGRREMLWFDVASSDLRRMAGVQTVVLKAGNARFKVSERRMETVRELVRRMTPLERGPQ